VPLPPGLGDVVMRCIEKDPAQRYQSVGELARSLAPFATDPAMAAQSAGRALRILQQRGAQQGMQASPLAAGGGLAVPIPLSPAQLTPRSWPPSQGTTSVSQGAGQVTVRTRSARGWLIASVAGLCVLAAVGGYAISQLSRPDDRSGETRVHAPEPASAPSAAAAAVPAAATPSTPSTTPSAPPTAPPATPSAPSTAPSTATAPPAPTEPAGAPASDAPPTWRANPAVKPTLPDHSADPSADKKPDAKSADGSPAHPRLIDSKRPAATKTADARSTDAKSTDAKPTDAKPGDAKSGKSAAKPVETKPAKPSKPKKDEDLFGTRH
jgi:hypothetical protein